MARKKNVGADIDWYLISIQRLKQVGLFILLLALGISGWWFFTNQKRNPRSTAEAAIAEARSALNDLAASKDFTSHRSDFDRAQKKLDEASTLLLAGKYVNAQESAIESQTISRAALSGGGAESDAQFLNVEGDVQFQKSSTADWKRADPRVPLFNGDWVKTGESASAELMFSNGSLYTVGPNALLEIYAQFNAATSKTSNSVQMQIGSIEVATTDDASTVRTPSSQVTVDSESSTQVAVDKQKATSVMTVKGSASVASSSGGTPVKLNTGEKVSATAAGSLSPVRKLLLPPALLTPADNQVYPMTDSTRVDFSWESVPSAAAYVFQVSRSRMFATLEINSRRQKNTAEAKVTSEGSFYWRVASVSPDGEPGPFSVVRRFRVSGSGRDLGISPETPPPALQLKRPYPIGGPFYMIEGTTDPGSTVFINDEEVDVESSGHFKKLVSFNKIGRNTVVVKAVNAAGKQTIQSETVLVEE
ncbi:MAG TPA: FecR domain-containing protein [Thermoanaerobaculia bacterium]|nr:FecR domain-containing protein [Thermoanaerobaculia bacterium]